MADTKLTDLTEQTSAPAQTDLVETVDVFDTTHDASGTSKKLTVAKLLDTLAGLTAKTTPVDADSFPMVDSEASDVSKRVTGTNLKAYLKTYFDTLYALASHNHATSDITSGTFADARIAASNVTQHQASIDHGSIAGLGDDDHTQYTLISSGAGAPGTTPSRVGLLYVDTTADDAYISTGTASSGDWTQVNNSAGSSDHGGLTGLSDDDHTQYSIITSGAGSPSATPARVGAIYIDTTADDAYMAVGTTSGDWVQIDTAAGAGEANTGSSLGTGSEVFKQKSGVDLQFRSIIAGSTKLSNTENTNDITLDVVEANINALNLSNAPAEANAEANPDVVSQAEAEAGTATTERIFTAQRVAQAIAALADIAAASDTVAGKVELATAAETDTGTDATRAVTPDGLQGSLRNIRFVKFDIAEADTDVATGTGLAEWVAPFDGTIIQNDSNKEHFMAKVKTAGTTGTMVIDIHKNGTTIMTTNKLDIETGETTTTTAATQPDLTTTTFVAGDVFTVDIDAVQTTAAQGTCFVQMAVRPD